MIKDKKMDALFSVRVFEGIEETRYIMGVAHHNGTENEVRVDFLMSEGENKPFAFVVGFADTGIKFTQPAVDLFVEETVAKYANTMFQDYFENVQENNTSYEMKFTSGGKDEEIGVDITIPIGERLAELIDRSAIREFFGEYNEGEETITLHGETLHSL